MTKIQELRTLTDAELKEKMLSLEKELFELRAKASTDKIEKPSRFREIRKEKARILTLLKEKERPS